VLRTNFLGKQWFYIENPYKVYINTKTLHVNQYDLYVVGLPGSYKSLLI
jgi:hypothetical protein